jgi:hypothetical protein
MSNASRKGGWEKPNSSEERGLGMFKIPGDRRQKMSNSSQERGRGIPKSSGERRQGMAYRARSLVGPVVARFDALRRCGV